MQKEAPGKAWHPIEGLPDDAHTWRNGPCDRASEEWREVKAALARRGTDRYALRKANGLGRVKRNGRQVYTGPGGNGDGNGAERRTTPPSRTIRSRAETTIRLRRMIQKRLPWAIGACP